MELIARVALRQPHLTPNKKLQATSEAHFALAKYRSQMQHKFAFQASSPKTQAGIMPAFLLVHNLRESWRIRVR